MKKKLIVANWKMNFAFEEADKWLNSFLPSFFEHREKIDVILCPSAVLLDHIDSVLIDSNLTEIETMQAQYKAQGKSLSEEEAIQLLLDMKVITLGAQDCHHQESGAFTGSISPYALRRAGAQYVILGHSERRLNLGETDQLVADKVRAALRQFMTPIICVGETEEIRNRNEQYEFVYQQIMNSIPPEVEFSDLIIAYEPVWAIGTGTQPTAEQLEEMIAFIYEMFNGEIKNFRFENKVIYGGSVSSETSSEILKFADGLLVGKASLDPKEFLNIVLSAEQYYEPEQDVAPLEPGASETEQAISTSESSVSAEEQANAYNEEPVKEPSAELAEQSEQNNLNPPTDQANSKLTEFDQELDEELDDEPQLANLNLPTANQDEEMELPASDHRGESTDLNYLEEGFLELEEIKKELKK